MKEKKMANLELLARLRQETEGHDERSMIGSCMFEIINNQSVDTIDGVRIYSHHISDEFQTSFYSIASDTRSFSSASNFLDDGLFNDQ